MLEDGEYQYYSQHGQDGQWESEFVVIHTWYIISGKCILYCMSGLEQTTTRVLDSPLKEQGVLQSAQCESHQLTPAVYQSTQVAPGLPVCRWSLHHHTFGTLCFQPDLWFTPKQVYGDPREGVVSLWHSFHWLFTLRIIDTVTLGTKGDGAFTH